MHSHVILVKTYKLQITYKLNYRLSASATESNTESSTITYSQQNVMLQLKVISGDQFLRFMLREINVHLFSKRVGSVVFVVKGKLTRFNSFDILNRDELVYEKCTVK